MPVSSSRPVTQDALAFIGVVLLPPRTGGRSLLVSTSLVDPRSLIEGPRHSSVDHLRNIELSRSFLLESRVESFLSHLDGPFSFISPFFPEKAILSFRKFVADGLSSPPLCFPLLSLFSPPSWGDDGYSADRVLFSSPVRIYMFMRALRGG